MKLIIVSAVILYVITVWGNGITQDFATMQKERQERIDKVLKGE